MDLVASREALVHALAALDRGISTLVAALAHSSVFIVLEDEADSRSALRRACEAIAAIDYDMEQAVNQSVVCLGVIGASPDILKQVRVVNAAKLRLKNVCAPLQKVRMRISVKGGSGPTRAIPVTRVLLRNIQRSDLNLLAAYRKIPTLDATPGTVTYTVARTRAVYRKPVNDIYEMLVGASHPKAMSDRLRLESLSRRETHLALVRERYSNVRANVRFARLDPRGRGRAQFAAELPLMFAMRARDAPPEVSFPEAGADTGAARRVRPAILEARPFLNSLSVYRYLNP